MRFGILPFASMMRKMRLFYFTRSLMHAPECLVRLVALEHDCDPPNSYVACIVQDLKWIYKQVNDGPLKGLGDPWRGESNWVTFIKNYPAVFKLQCRRVFNKANDGVMFAAGFSIDEAANKVKKQAVIESHPFVCRECGLLCKSKAVLDGHLSPIHHNRNVVRDVVDTIVCQSCLHEYKTRHRMIVHLACNAPACRHKYFVNIHPLDADVVECLDLQEAAACRTLKSQGRSRRYSSFPSVKLQGPRPFN